MVDFQDLVAKPTTVDALKAATPAIKAPMMTWLRGLPEHLPDDARSLLAVIIIFAVLGRLLINRAWEIPDGLNGMVGIVWGVVLSQDGISGFLKAFLIVLMVTASVYFWVRFGWAPPVVSTLAGQGFGQYFTQKKANNA